MTQQLPTLREYYTLLKNHDWHYEMTDDTFAYFKGKSSINRIQGIAENSPTHAVLYTQYKSFVFRKGPKPEEPQSDMNKLWNDVLEHWERAFFNPWVEVLGKYTCSFCREYNNPVNKCNGCPIREYTGIWSCHNTPYNEAAACAVWAKIDGVEYTPTRQLAVWEEYRFLVRLYRGSKNESKS